MSCSKKEITDSTTVAKIGDIRISAKDFRISYELAPASPKRHDGSIQSKKSAHLRSMIEQKLLTIAGLEDSLDRAQDVQRLLKWYEKQAVIRELYRQVVSKEVQVSEEETREAYILLNERLLLRQFLLNSEIEANAIYRRAQNGETFEQIAMDFTHSEAELNRILTGREFTWGELDKNLETAVFGLNKNEISAPIRTNSGYHIVQLLDRKKNLILSEYGYQERQHYVETIIRRRKEANLAREYARAMMKKIYPRAVGPVLLELSDRAEKAIRIEDTEHKIPPYLQVRRVRPHIEDLLDKNLVIFNGGSWTVGEFLAMIEQAHPKSRPDLTNPGALKVSLSVMVRDEFLARKGYERQLDQSSTVREELAGIRDEIVAMRMRNALLDTVQVSENEVQNYFHKNRQRYQIPERVNIREIMVRDRKLADSLYAAIQDGADIAALASQFSVRKWAAKKDGELGYITREAFGEIGKKAFAMQIGELSGPVPVKLDTFTVGYSVFRVIGQKPPQKPELHEIYEKVSKEALAEKKQRVLLTFLQGVQERHPVSLDESILASIRTLDELGTGRPIDILKIGRL